MQTVGLSHVDSTKGGASPAIQYSDGGVSAIVFIAFQLRRAIAY